MEKSEASLPFANCPNTCSRQRPQYPNSICRGETNDAIQIVIHGVFQIWSDSVSARGLSEVRPMTCYSIKLRLRRKNRLESRVPSAPRL